MFDSILPKMVFPKDVSFVDPKYLTLRFDGEDDNIVSIEKGASTIIYKNLDLKEGTSKDVFKKSSDIWIELIRLCEDRAKENKNNFYFNKTTNCFYVTDGHELIDLYDAKSNENVEFLKAKYEEFKLGITERTKTNKLYTEGKDGLVKVILYSSKLDINSSKYAPVVILEANPIKSKYLIYTGILLLPKCILIPNVNEYGSFNQYSDMICNFDIDYALECSTSKAEDLYNDYLHFKEEPVEISARELISLLNKVGFKLELNNDNDIGEIDAIVEQESNDKIQKFFNTFKFTTGETAVDILNLSEFRKIFRYNNLTFLDVLEMLSAEYVKYTGAKITVDILIGILIELYTKSNDEQQVKFIKKEI